MTVHWRKLLISILMILISHGLAEATPFTVFEYGETDALFSLKIEHGPIDTDDTHPVLVSTPNWQISFTIQEQAFFLGDFVAFGASNQLLPPGGKATHATGVAGHPNEVDNPTPFAFTGGIRSLLIDPAFNKLTDPQTGSIPHPPNAGHIDNFSLNLTGSANQSLRTLLVICSL